MHAAAAPFSFNPFDEQTRRDPYGLFARARREHPAWRHEGLPVVSVFRHADCQAILRDPQAWSSAFPTPPGFAPEDVPRSMLVTDPPERVATLRRVRGELEAYFVRLVEARRREPRDDLLSALVAAELEGSRLSFAELLAMLILLLVAGNETTTHLIGNAVLALLAQPEALAALRADPARVPAAVEEVLRVSSPVQMDPRLATREAQLHGVAVAAGEAVLCWLGSANRDEAVYEHAEVFDIGRERKPDVAFGFGPHYCLGASLATLEAEVALRVLLERTRRFRRVDDVPRSEERRVGKECRSRWSPYH